MGGRKRRRRKDVAGVWQGDLMTGTLLSGAICDNVTANFLPSHRWGFGLRG